MTMLSKLDCDRAPCGCPAARRYSQYNPSTCPASQRGVFPQWGTDLQLPPLIEQHVQYCDALEHRLPEAPMSWQSISTQMGGINIEEGPGRRTLEGLASSFPMRLTPQDGTNLNEHLQLERAGIRSRARRISESLARMVEGEPQYDVEVDENGYPVYASSHRPVPMGPTYFSPPTGLMTGTMTAQHGNPSSRGKSSSHHSGRRSSHDQSSSGRGGNSNYVMETGVQFAEDEADYRPSELSVSEYSEDGFFQYEE